MLFRSWVDVGDARFGVALLNDSKYGHSVQDNVLGLSLLRSPLSPDPDADAGHHRFTYALLPHEGDLTEAGVIEAAACLNRPPLLLAGLSAPVRLPVTVEGEAVSSEAIKKAEKDESWIVRVVENLGLGARGVLHVAIPGANVCTTDLLEWNDGPSEPAGDGVRFSLKPFEIRTFKIRFGS